MNALNEMLKRVQHDKKKYVIPNLFRNLEFGNDNELTAFVLVSPLWQSSFHERSLDQTKNGFVFFSLSTVVFGPCPG